MFASALRAVVLAIFAVAQVLVLLVVELVAATIIHSAVRAIANRLAAHSGNPRPALH